MASSIEDLERRVEVLESRVRAGEVDQQVINQKLDGVIGSQDVMLGLLREHGRELDGHRTILSEHGTILREHGTILHEHTAKLDMIVAWIQRQP